MDGAKSVAALLLVLSFSAAGCGNSRTNPVGVDLIRRGPGGVTVDTISLSGRSIFEGLTNFVYGPTIDLRVGRMNGILFRSLLRFDISLDLLLDAAGVEDVDALTIESVEVTLRRLEASFQRGQAAITVSRPDRAWDEFTQFVDSASTSEISLPATPISGAAATPSGEDALRVVLPVSVFSEASQGTDATFPIEILLGPDAGDDFLAVFASRDTAAWAPELEVVYSANGRLLPPYTTASSSDTYWAARDDRGGPASDLLLVQSGIRYSAMLQFDTTGVDIPLGATINAVELHLDTDERSFVEMVRFPFKVVRVDVTSGSPLVGDNRFTDFLEVSPGMVDAAHALDPVLLQGWPSEPFLNNGLSLSALSHQHVAWLVAGRPWLQITYVEPPEIE